LKILLEAIKMGDDNYNTIEILKAVEEIMKEKIISEKKQKDYDLPPETIKIIAEAESYIEKN